MIKKQKFISGYEYYNPVTFTNLLVDLDYIMLIRQDRGEFVRDYFISRYKIPFYITNRMYQGITGFPISKRLNKKVKFKLYLM